MYPPKEANQIVRKSYGVSAGEIVVGAGIAVAGTDSFLTTLDNYLHMDLPLLHTLPLLSQITNVTTEIGSLGSYAEVVTAIVAGIAICGGLALFADGAVHVGRTRKVQKNLKSGIDY